MTMILEKLVKLLICPVCNGSLTATQVRLECDNCDQQYPMLEGIPLLANNMDFYYGEIPREKMEAVLDNKGGGSIVDRLTEETAGKWVSKYALSKERCVLKLLVDTDHCSTALDLGSGWGNLSIAIAESVGQVVAADLSALRVRFLARRCSEERVSNVACICLGDGDKLPFRSNSFDMVVLNGVLEWVPESIPGNPREVQKMYLAEVLRILKPGGQLFVGIENRFGYGYLMGRREDHTYLRFGAVLPRTLANIYSLWKRRKPYRTYTYSKNGYKRLLKEAGYQNINIYGAWPDYREPQVMGDTNSQSGMSAVFNRTPIGITGKPRKLLTLAGKTKFAGMLVPSFMIVASPTDNLRACLIENARETLGSFAKLLWLAHNAGFGGIVACLQTKDGDVIARTAFNDSMEERCRRNYTSLKFIASRMEEPFRAKIPTPIGVSRVLDRFISYETRLPGLPATQASNLRRLDLYFKQTHEFLRSMHSAAGNGTSEPTCESDMHKKEFLQTWLKGIQEMFISITGTEFPHEIIQTVLNHPDLDKVHLGRIH
ncbi:tRNA 5-carboxymethoxyuridine methyltransferase [subsurface metagenome]